MGESPTPASLARSLRTPRTVCSDLAGGQAKHILKRHACSFKILLTTLRKIVNETTYHWGLGFQGVKSLVQVAYMVYDAEKYAHARSERSLVKIKWSEIDPHELEFFVSECFSKLGYSVIQTKLTVDGGVDVIADKFDEATRSWLRFVIQVKRHDAPIGVGKVRELNGVLDDFKAVKGILIGTGGFTRSAKDFERDHIERVSLWDASALVKLLRAANLIDPEGNIRKPTDPNLKSNRRNSICMMLQESRPACMNSEEIAEMLRKHHRVTVPIKVIEVDLAELSERGDVIELKEGLYHARILEAEIQEICTQLRKGIFRWDFHFSESDISDYVAKNYKISCEYVQRFMQDSLGEILNSLKKSGLLYQFGDRYLTEQGLENFRNIRLSKNEMRKNLVEFFGFTDKDLKKPISSLITVNEAITLLDEKDPQKKICAFNQILPFKCTGCGRFTFEAIEVISLMVVPSSLKIEFLEIRMAHSRLQSLKPDNVVEIMKCSWLYVERMKELIDSYEIGKDGVSAFSFHVDDVVFVLDLNLKEESTLEEMIDSIVRESHRFQSFLIDLNQHIPGYGLPRPTRIGLIERIVPAKEVHENQVD